MAAVFIFMESQLIKQGDRLDLHEFLLAESEYKNSIGENLA
jgi:hypothetical protein